MQIPSIELANGDRIPAIGLGTWKSDPGVVGSAVGEAIGLGYRHMDCAPIYGNEPEVGEALEAALTGGAVSRDELWVTSKLWNSCHFRDDVTPALEKTLGDLRLDYLDLFLIHWPIALTPGSGFPKSLDEFLPPEAAPIEETWAAMEEAVDAGLCRHIGLSNFNVPKLRHIRDGARIAPSVVQVESHPFLAQDDLLEACGEMGVAFTAYCPLGSPDRPERVRKESDPFVLQDPVIASIADKHGVSPAQVVLGWGVKRGTAVIPKTVTPSRLVENLESAAVPLDADDMAAIAGLDRGHRLIDGRAWCPEGAPYTQEWLWER
jgi:alcohol dehydrogenase (NADP+)